MNIHEPPDERVTSLLDELGLQYEIDEDRSCEVRFTIEDTRPQSVFIESETFEVDKLEIREVSAIGGKWDSALPKDIANLLLVHNAKVDIGAWRLIRLKDDSCILSFVAPVAAETTASTLQSIMHAVALAADFIEEELSDEE